MAGKRPDEYDSIQHRFYLYRLRQYAKTPSKGTEVPNGCVVAVWLRYNMHEEWKHAINQTVTTEGLVYVEPQMDLWWYASQCEIRAGNDYLVSYFDPPLTVHIDRIAPIALP